MDPEERRIRLEVTKLMKQGKLDEARKLVCQYRVHEPVDLRISEFVKGEEFQIFSEDDVKTADKIVHMFLRGAKRSLMNRDYYALASLHLGNLVNGGSVSQKETVSKWSGHDVIHRGATAILSKYEKGIVETIVSTYSNLYDVYRPFKIIQSDLRTLLPPFKKIISKYYDVFEPCAENPVAQKINFSEKIPEGMIDEQMGLIEKLQDYMEIFGFVNGRLTLLNRKDILEKMDKEKDWLGYPSRAYNKLLKLGLVEKIEVMDPEYKVELERMRGRTDKHDIIHKLAHLPGKYEKVFQKYGFERFKDISF